MIQDRRNLNLIFNLLLCCCIFFFFSACASVDKKDEKSKLTTLNEHNYTDDSSYNIFVKTSKVLAEKIFLALEHESKVKWTAPLQMEFDGDRWNSFLDQLNIFMMEELSAENIQIVKKDWEFSEDEFSETSCPDELLLPGYQTKIKVKHYPGGGNFLVTAETRRFNSKGLIRSGVNSVNISGKDYGVALQAWNEPQTRWQSPPIGSRSNPFKETDRVAKFMAHRLPCKMEIASERWKKFVDEEVDFTRLRYQLVAFTQSTGVSPSLVKNITARINHQLKDVGLQVVVAEDELQNIINQVGYLQKFKPYYFDEDRRSGETKLRASEALILVEVSPAESYAGLYEIKLRTIISSSKIAGNVAAQGLVIPNLGGECFFSFEEPLSFKLSPLQPQKNDNFSITITGNVNKVTSFKIFEGQKCIYPNLCTNDNVAIDFTRQSVFRIPDYNSQCLFFRSAGVIEASYRYNGNKYLVTLLDD